MVVCGGMTCPDDGVSNCGQDFVCYQWRAGEEEWTLHSTMTATKFYHLMAEIPRQVNCDLLNVCSTS